MDLWTNEQVLEFAHERNVSFIRLQFTDMFGMLKNIAVTVNQLEKALEGRLSLESPSISKYCRVEESDLYLRPDPSTFVVFPWRPRDGAVARLMCDIEKANGEPFPGCSRSILKKVIREAEDKGYSVAISSKAKFFLFLLDEAGKPTIIPHDKGDKFDLTPLDLGENARREIILNLEDMGFQIETSHHELAPGQHEINFKADDLLITADGVLTYKYVTRTIVQRHGLHATFMPKPLRNANGSGMTFRFFLFKDGKNAFVDKEKPNRRSASLEYFIGGLLEHAPALGALANPTVNSYKRLVDGDAPNIAAWSESSRATSLRVPPSRDDTFVEWRSPDASCNPYLAIAAAVKAGLEGMEKQMVPPPPLNMDVRKLSQSERDDLKINCVPLSLGESIMALEADPVIGETIGDYIREYYAEAKKRELEDYLKEVHDWELQQYFNRI